ncbi:MAG: class I SAM-dependent methyltransferase [Pseudomonadota bacterium]
MTRGARSPGSMVTVTEQYEVYPYPERDPADEDRRLIVGSPSDPREIDHFLHGGTRDWSSPMRALFAGGGTGDGLVQFAQQVADAGRDAEITYIDVSKSARAVAEARAARRGLTKIRFLTGSLLDASDHGQFDYIDCCGVLHHLKEPSAGFSALRTALSPGGGMGFMVYAPHGRSGVYALQQAFGSLFQGLPPEKRVSEGRKILAGLPMGHPFKANSGLVDHVESDAGFYDLLLHSQDRAFSVPELLDVLGGAGWRLQGFTMSRLYDLDLYATHRPKDLSDEDAMALAEKLAGTIKTHVAYAVPREDLRPMPLNRPWAETRKRIPHLKGAIAKKLAQRVADGGPVSAGFGGVKRELDLPKATAPLLGLIDGRRTAGNIAKKAKLEPARAAVAWARIEAALAPWGMLLYSDLYR